MSFLLINVFFLVFELKFTEMCQQFFVASSSVLFAPKYKCLVLKERHPKKAKVRMFQVVLKALKYYRACSLWGDENTTYRLVFIIVKL